MSYLKRYKEIYPISLYIFNNYIPLLYDVKINGHKNNKEYEIYYGYILSTIDSKNRFVRVYVKFVPDYDGLVSGYIETVNNKGDNKIVVVINEIVISEDIEVVYNCKNWSHNCVLQIIIHEVFHHMCPIVNDLNKLNRYNKKHYYYDRYYEQSAILVALIEHFKYYTTKTPTNILYEIQHYNSGMYFKINPKKVCRLIFLMLQLGINSDLV